MGKFDNLLLKAKDLAGVAGNKAQEVAELTKLKLQATQMRNEIDSNYMKLGEIVYELEKNGTQNEELVNMCVAEIEAKLQELEEVNQKINEMKKVVKCPECGAESPAGSLYCSRCGASLAEKPEDQEPQEPQEPDAPQPEAAEEAAPACPQQEAAQEAAGEDPKPEA